MAREMCWGHERRIEEGIKLFERDRELRIERERLMAARVERREG